MQPLITDDPPSIGPYRLVARLGAGGMGQVYLARSAGGRTVAVKVVRADLAGDPGFRDRFRREVAAAQAVNGTFTASVVDADRDSATPWLATTYVLGPSLAEAVAAWGPLPEVSVRAIGAVLAEALTAIHGAGLVHRDLKPSNVLLAADGPRVIDFGIARALNEAGSTLTSTGVVVGSPGFMSPEQAAGLRVGPAGDVFSLGSVLAFAATGNGPFGQESAASLLYRVVHEQPDLEQVPGSLREAVAACLAKDPVERPTPAALLALLAPEGTAALLHGGTWLPTPVASGIAQHAARVMELETPAPSPAAGGAARPNTGPGPGFSNGKAGGAAYSPTLAVNSGAPATGASAEDPTPAGADIQAAASLSRRRLLYGVLGAAAVAAAGGSVAIALSGSGTDKPTVGGTAAAAPSARPQTRPPGVAPQPIWTYTASGTLDVPPVSTPYGLLVTDKTITALDPHSGAQKWTGPEQTVDGLHEPFALSGGFMVAALSGVLDTLAGFDPHTGLQKWTWQLPNHYGLESILGANDQAVFLSAAGGLLVAVDPQTRTILWTQKRQVAANGGDSAAGFATGRYLVYTNDNDHVVVRDAATGGQLWVAEAAGQKTTQMPLLAEDTLYLAGDQVIGYGLDKGDKRMATATAHDPVYGGASLYSGTAYADGVIYSAMGFGVVAVDARSGLQLWQGDVNDASAYPLMVVQDTVFVPLDAGQTIVALDRKSGHLLWSFSDRGDKSAPWLLATDGTNLFAAHDNHLYALPPR
ncbi:serine/threonine protein kinase [Streptacidiphilus pinicola]|uniref:Serine/threonine protein kinase n=1 Tax=Streptacidiphilus pinicola TaxID=2219663 RepID=A0A2X0IG63_9ACTN|nr:serine/threonine-protein kinase [Streptacidiphilus pinicola]RAG84022.1 serine/threonine protein kinase [Streptacidiphilus pinicola]